jgi:hypothetical protein
MLAVRDSVRNRSGSGPAGHIRDGEREVARFSQKLPGAREDGGAAEIW